jgi:cold shock CspA family protein
VTRRSLRRSGAAAGRPAAAFFFHHSQVTNMRTGTILKLNLERGFGFIGEPGEADTFFHISVLDGLPFDEQLIGQRVEYEAYDDERSGKPRASIVRPAH